MLCTKGRGYSIKQTKGPAHVSGSRNKWKCQKNLFLLWDIIFMSGVTGNASHSKLMSGFNGWTVHCPSMPHFVWLMKFHVRMCLYIPGYPRTSREFKNLKFKTCIDKESNSGSPGCLCRHMIYTTEPKFIYKNNKSENLNLNRHHLVSFFSILSKSRFQTNFRLWEFVVKYFEGLQAICPQFSGLESQY